MRKLIGIILILVGPVLTLTLVVGPDASPAIHATFEPIYCSSGEHLVVTDNNQDGDPGYGFVCDRERSSRDVGMLVGGLGALSGLLPVLLGIGLYRLKLAPVGTSQPAPLLIGGNYFALDPKLTARALEQLDLLQKAGAISQEDYRRAKMQFAPAPNDPNRGREPAR